MKFFQVRNATARIHYGDHVFLLDPWLQDFHDSPELRKKVREKRFIGQPVRALPQSPEKILEGVDTVLVTHLHEDHFSRDYLPEEIPILVQNQADRQALENLGFRQVKTFEKDHALEDTVSIQRLDAVHGENASLAAQMGPVSGYILESPGEKTVYLVGDSIYTPVIQQNIDRFNPEILVVNGCDARISRGRLIMDEKDILALAERNPERKIIVSHMDGVSHAFLTRASLKKTIEQKGLEDRVFVPEDGEILEL